MKVRVQVKSMLVLIITLILPLLNATSPDNYQNLLNALHVQPFSTEKTIAKFLSLLTAIDADYTLSTDDQKHLMLKVCHELTLRTRRALRICDQIQRDVADKKRVLLDVLQTIKRYEQFYGLSPKDTPSNRYKYQLFGCLSVAAGLLLYLLPVDAEQRVPPDSSIDKKNYDQLPGNESKIDEVLQLQKQVFQDWAHYSKKMRIKRQIEKVESFLKIPSVKAFCAWAKEGAGLWRYDEKSLTFVEGELLLPNEIEALSEIKRIVGTNHSHALWCIQVQPLLLCKCAPEELIKLRECMEIVLGAKGRQMNAVCQSSEVEPQAKSEAKKVCHAKQDEESEKDFSQLLPVVPNPERTLYLLQNHPANELLPDHNRTVIHAFNNKRDELIDAIKVTGLDESENQKIKRMTRYIIDMVFNFPPELSNELHGQWGIEDNFPRSLFNRTDFCVNYFKPTVCEVIKKMGDWFVCKDNVVVSIRNEVALKAYFSILIFDKDMPDVSDDNEFGQIDWVGMDLFELSRKAVK